MSGLTINQKKTLMALAYDGSYQYFPSQAPDTKCVGGATRDAHSPWWSSPRSLDALRRKGLLDVRDAGSGSWRGSLNKYGLEVMCAIIATDPDWLHDHPQKYNRDNARKFLDGIMLPPGRPRSIAAIVRDAQKGVS